MIKNYIFKYNKSLMTLLAIILLIAIFCYPVITYAKDNNNALAAVLKSITTVIFIAFFTLLAGITLLAIAVMLIIRYVYLTILLMVSPIVWLLWIFPATKEHWQKWWSQFLRWAFFAPLMLFFLYLTISVIDAYPAMFVKYTAGIGDLNNQGFAISVAYIGNLVAILGLLLGGLIAANSLGITFAGTAYGWAQSVGKSFGGWAGRKGVQLGTSPLRGKLGTKAIEAIEKFGATGKTGLGWRALQTITQPIRAQIGERLSSLAVAGGEKAVAAAMQRYKDWDDKRLAKAIYSLDAPERVAALQRLRANKTLDLLPDPSVFINQETEDLFIKYGQAKPDYTNLERAAGYNKEMSEIMKARAAGDENFTRKIIQPDGKTVKKEMKIDEAMDQATNDFYKNFRPEHFNKMQIDEFFSGKKELILDLKEKRYVQAKVVKAILETNPDGLANVYRGIKGNNLDNFNNLLFEFIDKQKGDKTRRGWLASDSRYKRLLIWLESPAARSLGMGPKLEEDEKGQSAGPTIGGYESGRYD